MKGKGKLKKINDTKEEKERKDENLHRKKNQELRGTKR